MLINQLSKNHAVQLILDNALQAEHNAFYLYQHLSLQCQRMGLFGAANFFAKESTEELSHAKRIEDFYNDMGSVAGLPILETPDVVVSCLADALNAGYQAELDLGEKYARWYGVVLPKCPTTAQFLLQFIEIQRLSTGEYGDLVQRLSLVCDDKCGVLLIDKELGEK